jgi:hypothetical protein
MLSIEPVELIVRLVASKKTENGLLGGFTEVEVLSANGEVDPRFYGFPNFSGYMVLNFKGEGRPAKPAKKPKPAPIALTAAQKAQIPANGTKGKAKAKAEPAATAPAPVGFSAEQLAKIEQLKQLGLL